ESFVQGESARRREGCDCAAHCLRARVEELRLDMPRINLLPWREEQRKQRIKNFGVAAATAVGVGIATVLYAHVTMNRFIAHQNARNTYLETEIATLDKQIAEIKELETTKERLL